MGAIQTKFLLKALLSLLIIETVATLTATDRGIFPIEHLGLLRMIESIVLLLIARLQKEGLGILGLDRRRLLSGFKTGIIWSSIFAVIAAIGFLILFFLKLNPLILIRVPLPQTPRDLIIFFLVGGVIAPISEEIFFRGILFGYLSKWGLFKAVIISTLIFVSFHLQAGLTQAVGGVVFALSYHFGHSLLAPIIIHSLGNLALFSISLLT
jgi:uncharacterized protein